MQWCTEETRSSKDQTTRRKYSVLQYSVLQYSVLQYSVTGHFVCVCVFLICFCFSFVYAALVFSFCSFAFSLVGLFMLIACPALMIKAGLIFTVVIMIVWTVYSFIYLNFIWGILAAVFLLFTLCYVKLVWSRIPFAAINMKTGGTAIKANLGVTICAMFFTLLSVGWLVLWSISLSGIYEKTYTCDANNRCSPNYGVLFGMFLSLFFGQQVLQSCVHVTVAGTVGTWVSSPFGRDGKRHS